MLAPDSRLVPLRAESKCGPGAGRAVPSSSGGSRGKERDDGSRVQAGARRGRRRRDRDRRAGPRGRLSSATAASTSRSSSAGTRSSRSGACSSTRLRAGPAARRALRARGADRPRARRRPGDDRALAGEWELGQLIDIDDDQAKEDLRRCSALFLSIVAQSARVADGKTDKVAALHDRAGQDRRRALPARVARRGPARAREGDRHLLDLHRRARPERVDLHRARRRLDRRRRGRRALVGGRRALRPAARRRPGAGAADARRGRRVRRRRGMGARRARPRRAADGLRPPRLPRRGPARPAAAPDGEGARLRRATTSPRSSSRRRSPRCASARPTGRSRRTSSTGRRSCSTSRTSRRRSRRRCSPARARRAGRRTSSSRSGRAS